MAYQPRLLTLWFKPGLLSVNAALRYWAAPRMLVENHYK
jgi:hypothetical protein